MATRRNPADGVPTPPRLKPTASAQFSPAAVAGPARGPSRLDQLSSALENWTDVGNKVPAFRAREKAKEAAADKAVADRQKEVLPYYIDATEEARGEGTLSAEQVQEMYPELHPTNSAAVANAMGAKDARGYMQEKMQTLYESDDLRLNTEARLKYLDEVRTEAQEIYGNNPDYGSGFVTRMDAVINQHEVQFMQETASYQRDVVKDEFTNRVLETIGEGGDLMALDAEYKEGPLSNLERNEIVRDSYIDAAIAARDPSMVENIPARFLNAETRAQIPKMRQEIRTDIFNEVVQENRMEGMIRDEELREGKRGVLQLLASGETVNPSDYRGNPDLYEYAARFANADPVNDTQSVAAKGRFRSNILLGAFSGDFENVRSSDPQFNEFFSGKDVSEQTLREHILVREDLNPKEKEDLLEEIPALMDGMVAMADPVVQEAYRNGIQDHLTTLGASSNERISNLVTGTNMEADASRRFRRGIHERFLAYYEDNNAWPRGNDRRVIVNDVEDRTRTYISDQIRLGSGDNPEASSGNPERSTRGTSGATAGGSDTPSRVQPVPLGAVDFLRDNDSPENRKAFESKYGYLPEDID